MNTSKFESKYKEKGGLQKLTELRSLFFSQKYIANHFGVTFARVRQWMIIFFGREYDPREDRREAIVSSMVEFARHNGYPDFKFVYKGTPYYKEVLDLCRAQNIYEKKS